MANNKTDSTKHKIEIYNCNYLRNNEYFNEFEDGQTIFGQWAQAKYTYSPSKKLHLKIGLFAQKSFGSSQPLKILPLASLEYQNKNSKLIFGNVDGGIAHRLIEPLYHVQNFLLQPIETGIQFKNKTKSRWVDSWIDWQQSTFAGGKQQEHIWAGTVFTKRFTDFSLHAQGTVFHKGGQNLAQKWPVETYINASLGISYHRNGWTLQPMANFAHANNQTGFGSYFLVSYVVRDYTVGLIHFRSKAYVSPMASGTFSGLATKWPMEANKIDDRDFIQGNFQWSKNLTQQLKCNLRFEPLYFYKISHIDHSEALYLVFSL